MPKKSLFLFGIAAHGDFSPCAISRGRNTCASVYEALQIPLSSALEIKQRLEVLYFTQNEALAQRDSSACSQLWF